MRLNSIHWREDLRIRERPPGRAVEFPGMTVRSEKPTLEEFLSWPEEKPYLEFIHGEVRPKTMPGFPHGELQAEFISRVRNWSKPLRGRTMTEQRCLLEADGQHHAFLPDVAWWSAERLPVPALGAQRIPPTHAIEILSPSDKYGEVEDKVAVYLKSGVRVVWVVDPDARNVAGHRPGSIPEVVASPRILDDSELPGLQIPLAEIFAICDAPPMIQD